MKMRYVIVCLIKGEALEFHENLVNDVCKRFDVKRQRLPAHFTIKAPFESDDINQIEQLTEEFCASRESTKITLDGFGHFRDNVVFIDVKTSTKAVTVHDDYIDILKALPWLEWKRNEGKGRVFHCTVVSKIPSGKFKDIWNYTSDFNCYFETLFDNISILRWEKDRWVTYKEYKFKDRI
jgi:2'-5' RNA ligase